MSRYLPRFLTPQGNPARLWVRPQWAGEGGARELFLVSFPLILSAISGVLNLFFDRYFLSQYDVQYHMTASLSAGVTWWMMLQLFMGVVGYLSTFVAQYDGAGRQDRIGGCMWQAMYLALLGGVINIAIIPFLRPLFELVHGVGTLSMLEAEYCRILNYGSAFLLLNIAMSCFYSGRGKTRFVMVNSFITAGVNIALNKWWIFNPPEWLPFIKPGLTGAAWATTCSFVVSTVIFAAFVFSPRNQRDFKTLSAWRLDWAMMWRLVRYGFPQSIQQLVDLIAFTFFILMLGRADPLALTASNIAFTINHMVFVPLFAMSQAVSILVGQYVGAKRVEFAEKSTCTAELISIGFVAVMAMTYLAFPEFYVSIFSHEGQSPEMMAKVGEMAKVFLVFTAIYSVSDCAGILYAGAIKGAGDTSFVMWASAFTSILGLLIPTALAVHYGWSTMWMFTFVAVFVYSFAGLCLLRYRAGHWKTMTVIEHDLVAEVEQEHEHPKVPLKGTSELL